MTVVSEALRFSSTGVLPLKLVHYVSLQSDLQSLEVHRIAVTCKLALHGARLRPLELSDSSHIYSYIYIFIYTEKERERERDSYIYIYTYIRGSGQDNKHGSAVTNCLEVGWSW